MGRRKRILKRGFKNFIESINPVVRARNRRERELFSKSSYIYSYDEWLKIQKKYKI